VRACGAESKEIRRERNHTSDKEKLERNKDNTRRWWGGGREGDDGGGKRRRK
jgi:hypothetical protein